MKPSNAYGSWGRTLLLLVALLTSWLWITPDWPAQAASTNRLPVANAGTDQTVVAGDTVVLDGSASTDADGNALTFQWSFVSRPSGSITTFSDPHAVRPSFLVDKPGVYVAQLVVNDGQGDSAPGTVSISTANSAPVANAGPDRTVAKGQTVTLDASRSFDADGDPLAYAWSFVSRPTGSAAALANATSINPWFVVDKRGDYVVQLVVNDGHVNSLPDRVTLSILNSPPTANAGANQTAFVGDTIVLDGSASTDVDGDRLAYSWALIARPVGSTAPLQQPASVRPRFVMDKSGDYVAQLMVNDGAVDGAPATVTISTLNSPPIAHAGASQIVRVGDLVQLDGSGSTDVDGDSLQFIWSILSKPSQSLATLSSPFVVNPTFGVDQPGSYVVQLFVDDGTFTSAPDTVTISTQNRAPLANAGRNQTVQPGATVQLDGSASSDADGETLSFNWSLLSKPSGSHAALSGPHRANPTFVADLPGDYVAQLIVSDAGTSALPKAKTRRNRSATSSAPATVLISTVNSAPIADAGPAQTIAGGARVQLDGSASFDPDGQALSFDWSLTAVPSGSNATLSDPAIAKPSFVADQAGVYVAQLIVSDGLLESAPNTVLISVGGQINQAPQVDAGADQTITLPATAAFNGTVTDDGLPNPPGAVTTTWSKVSGPGTVSFSSVNSLVTSASFSQAGVYVVRLTANDGALSSSDDVQITVNAGANQPPVTQNDSATTSVGVAVPINVLANDSDPDGDTLTVSAFTQGANGSVTCLANGLCTYTPNPGFTGQDTFTYTASDGHGGATIGQVTVTVSGGGGEVNPPPVSGSVATTVANSTQFLYSGPNPIQTGVAPGTIAPVRAAVLRGKVLKRDGSPLPGAAITILGHPEFGQTVSRSDGQYDMAVNGGGTLTINYVAAGFLPAQRQVNVPWQDYVPVPEAILLALDGTASTIAMNTPAMQVHRGSVSSDADGNRQATVLFPAGTTATMVMPDGSTQTLSSLTVRATEFTVGPNGKKAMPAQLPPTSAYTYAVSFSADEAVAAGAKSIVFSQPVIQYAENFLNFPVGIPVPTGVYDPQKAAWLAIPDGRVIKILSVTGGLADVDSDGDGIADNALGMSNEERQNLAQLYAPGQTLWRTPLPHFSNVDNNWGFISVGATPPTEAGPVNDDPLQDPECSYGSIVECENQVLGESVPIVGTPFTLNYRSDREPGRLRERTIQLSGASPLSPQLASIGLTLSVAGRTFEQTFAPSPNQSSTFMWDGKDAYGRTLQGGQTLTGSVDYHYPASYASAASAGGPSFGVAPSGNVVLLEGFRDQTIAASLRFSTTIGEGLTDARALGLGGWTLSAHNFYDPIARVLHMGDGTRRRAESLSRVINTVLSGPASGVAGSLAGTSFAVAPDGSIYFLRQKPDFTYTVRRLSPDGNETIVAGNGSSFTPPLGDDGPAINASDISGPLALGPDGSIYVQSQDVIRRIGPDGIIRRFAGRYPTQSGGIVVSACSVLVGADGVPATDTDLCPLFYTVAPDGSMYISEHHFGGCDTNGCTPEFARVRRVGADGIINTVAGTTAGLCTDSFDPGGCDDGAPAIGARLAGVGPLQVAADGTLYLADYDRIKRIGPDGTIHTMAQGATSCLNAVSAIAIALGANGLVYASNLCGQVVSVAPDGTVTTFAGTLANPNNGAGDFVRRGDGGPTLTAGLGFVDTLAVAPDGTVVLTSNGFEAAADGTLVPGSLATTIRRIGAFIPGISTNDFTIASNDGSQLYVFDPSGLHLRTLNALTGATLYEFAYDANGVLSQITEKTGGTDNVTTIEHDASGNPTKITGPFGQVTTLAVDANGFLNGITNPAGEAIQLASDTGGLLQTYTDPRGKTSAFTYDADGRLRHDRDPLGGAQNLVRATSGDTFTVTRTTTLGRTTTYSTQRLTDNTQVRTITAPDTTQSQTQETIDAGTTHAVAANGTTIDGMIGPDPRFGMQSPLPKSVVIVSPGGLTMTVSDQLSATLTDPRNPLSLSSLVETRTINGLSATSVYTASTKTVVFTTPAGRVSTMTVDSLGRPTAAQVAGFDPVNVTYDSRGRLAVLTQGIGASARTTTLAYNADGFLSSFTDAASRTMSFGYDAAGRVTSRTLADGNTVSLAYDSAGNLTNLTPPGKLAHTLGYSDRNELISVTPPALPGSGSTIYAYDVDRKATTLTRPDGRTITLGYDSAGRIVTRSLAAGGVTVGTDTFGYDATGHLSAMAAANGVTLGYSYDGALMTGRTWSGPVAGSVTRSYDNSFRVAAESVNGGATIAYSYDADDLLIGAGALTIARDAQSGFPTSTSLGITTTAFGYNGFGEQTSYTAAAGGSQLFAQTFTRDALGRVASKSETVGGLTDTYAYSYDLAGQLTTVAKNGVTSESYVYDGNGDRISASVGANSVSGTYDDQDRLTAYGSTSFAYSAAGDLVSKTTGAAITTYQHDALGNLLSVTLPNGTTVSYLSDSNGRRVGKKINGSLVKGFIYSDRRRIAAELDGSGAVVTRFAYAGDDTPVAMIKGGVTFRVISDQNGSVRLIVDSATGAIAQRIDYDSFGNVILDTNRGFQPLGFAGGLYDPDTGLTRYGVRDYDPSIGRWTAKDPSWFAGNDGNLYRYASNDPVNLVDRTGKAATPPKTPNPFEELENIITKIERAHNPETGEPLEPFAEFSKRRKGIVELRKVGEWKKLQAQCLKEIDSIIDKFLKKLHGIGELPGIIDVVVEAIKADREGRDFTLKDAAETYLGYPLLDDLLGVPNSRLEI